MTPPTVKAGDAVNFVNAGKILPATVQFAHESGHADLQYADGNTPTVARGIPWCPNGGSFGWQLRDAAANVEAAPEAAAASKDVNDGSGASA